MTLKQRVISIYLALTALFGLYGWLFGQSSNKGLFYNLGKGFVWPTIIFPALGTTISTIVIVIVVILVLVFGKNTSN